MELEGTYTFDAPRDVVWQALMDPSVLAKVMPGCEKLEEVGDNEYEGAIKIKVGPVQGKFQGKVTLLDINEPDTYRMIVDGKGPSGFMKGEGQVQLEAQGNSTLMHYSGKAQVGGRIASVGQRLMDSSAKALTKQSLEGLNKQIEARVQSSDTAISESNSDNDSTTQEELPSSAPAAEAPSQTQFAVGVARNMLDEVIPPERRPLVIVIGLAVLGAIAYLIWGT